jgi:hypothetical protein
MPFATLPATTLPEMAMTHPPPRRAAYIGDGVYAWADTQAPGTVWLSTERDTGWAHIALEHETMAALVVYLRRVYQTEETIQPRLDLEPDRSTF